jgi:methyl-accepting chemotaxis protein
MSATSEELAAHAEQLQTSVAFFRMETSARANAAPHRPAAIVAPRRAAQAVAATRPSKTAVRPAPARAAPEKAKGNGFALNLTTGGADPRDAEFERM